MILPARLRPYLRAYRWRLGGGALCVAGAVASSLIKPRVIGQAIDAVAGGKVSAPALTRYALLLVGAAALEAVFLYMQRWVLIGTSRLIEQDMRNDFYAHLQDLPLRVFHEFRTGDLVSRVTNDLGAVRVLVGPTVLHTLSSAFVIAGSFAMMWRIDRGLSLIAAVSVPIVIALVRYFTRHIQSAYRLQQENLGAISARIHENVSGVRVVRAYTREAQERALFHELDDAYVASARLGIRLNATFYPVLQFLVGGVILLVFWLACRRILEGRMSVGSLVAFQFYLARMVWPLVTIGWIIGLLQRGLAALTRLEEIWKLRAEERGRALRAIDAPSAPPAVEIRGLTLRMNGQDVLRDVHLRAEAATTLGIVGATGSGKSTLLALLTGMLDAPPHTIFLGGRAIESIPKAKLRDELAFVPQETFLFSTSVASNIRYGRAEATDDELRAAAAAAGLDEDLQTGSLGLDEVLGERGLGLSGGQRQRVAIARALVRRAPVLLLDDALSATDTRTEAEIVRTLREMRGTKTMLIVSHRISAVKDADRIVVLERGQVVEEGTHAQLMARCGLYAAFAKRQALEHELEQTA